MKDLFIWIALCVFALDGVLKVLWLGTEGGSLPRSRRSMAVDVVLSLALVVFAALALKA